jgi:hypothetical protein
VSLNVGASGLGFLGIGGAFMDLEIGNYLPDLSQLGVSQRASLICSHGLIAKHVLKLILLLRPHPVAGLHPQLTAPSVESSTESFFARSSRNCVSFMNSILLVAVLPSKMATAANL